jgi:hypothetical protein
MTEAKIQRLINAAIKSARKQGVPYVDVKVGDEAVVRIPLVLEDSPIANDNKVVL